MDEPIHILSTRPLDATLEDTLLQAGFRLDTVPFIATMSVEDASTLKRLNHALFESLCVIFTSAHAVQALSEIVQGSVPDWEVYGLGHATAKQINELLPGLSIKGMAPDASRLADKILEDAPSRPIVFFCSDQRRDELPAKLKDAGVALEEIVVYMTVERSVTVYPVHDAILFFSPSAVKSYFKLNHPKAGCVLFAIGATTAAEIASYGDHPVILSQHPSAEDMVLAVRSHYKKIQ